LSFLHSKYIQMDTRTPTRHSQGKAVWICSGITKIGGGCKRKVNGENGKCYQHQAVAVTSLPNANGMVPESSPIEREHTPPSDTELDSLTSNQVEIVENISLDTPLGRQSDSTLGELRLDLHSPKPQETSPGFLQVVPEPPLDLGETGGNSFVALEMPLVPPPTLTTNLADPLDEEEKMLRISFWDKAKVVMLHKGN
jgi:hypothetical protein